jgi:hypothetical protein
MYHIKRGEQQFGPYSLTDLQKYVQSGNVVLDDLAQGEGMDTWVPVSQVLGFIPTAAPVVIDAAQQGFGAPSVPLPPNLPWPVLLVNYLYWIPGIGILVSIFVIVWSFILANWARKLSGKNTALVLMAMLPVGALSGGIAMGMGKTTGSAGLVALGGILVLAACICMVVAVFSIRSAVEDYYNSVENIGITLNGVMTFFFGIIYLQYHVNRLARWKRTGDLS